MDHREKSSGLKKFTGSNRARQSPRQPFDRMAISSQVISSLLYDLQMGESKE
jgi:hypothetical protein